MLNVFNVISEMEHKIIVAVLKKVKGTMPNDNAKSKKSPTEKTNKFKEMFGSHHDLRIFGSQNKRNVFV